MFARDKHSSLLRKSVNYGCKMFYSAAPGLKIVNIFLGKLTQTLCKLIRFKLLQIIVFDYKTA
jgi:hypothetical protein